MTETGRAAGHWRWRYVVMVVPGFLALYLLTRPGLLISDGAAWVLESGLGDPAREWYGFPSYFLQIPLAHGVWSALHALGAPVSVAGVFLAVSLAGTLAAIVFVGLIAGELLDSREAAWIAACLFGAALNPWTQWNGELSGLALGLTAAGLFWTLRGRIVWPALLWGLSVMAQINFVLAAPAFAVAVWWSRSEGSLAGTIVRRAVLLPALAGSVCLSMFLAGSLLVGKWHDLAGLAEWLTHSFGTADRHVNLHPEVFRAIKGLVTAYTAAGHVARDVFTGRSAFEHQGFLPAVLVGFALLAATGAVLIFAISRRQLVLFAMAWTLPFHVGFNWWWVPTEEEYHTGALPGLVLVITAGLLQLGARMSVRRRYALYAVYALTLAGLNLCAVVLPRQVLAADIIRLTGEVRQFSDEHQGRAVLVTCDGGNVLAVRNAGIEYLRIRSIWRGSVSEIQDTIVAWIRLRIAEGKEPYLLGRWCLPENWKTQWSKAQFDLYFLERDFRLGSSVIAAIPTDQVSVTDPFTWKRGDLVPLIDKNVILR